jgi:2,3-bisphosphoglycerate-independent phosphoglycerate mutase
MDVLDIPGVTDGLDNDYTAQAEGTLAALQEHDLVVAHIEAPDEAAHSGSVKDKVETIQRIDREVVARLRSFKPGEMRVLITPDHATPVLARTHTDTPVPFMIWGQGIAANGAERFTEAEARDSGLFIEEGYRMMGKLMGWGEGVTTPVRKGTGGH